MDKANVTLGGSEYVIVSRDEFDRLSGLAKAGSLPPLPGPDKDGNYPAIEYGRASLARKLIRARVEVGMSQKDLAQAAGIRVETLCRIEGGKHSASVPTVDKITRALRKAERAKSAQ